MENATHHQTRRTGDNLARGLEHFDDDGDCDWSDGRRDTLKVVFVALTVTGCLAWVAALFWIIGD